MLAKGCMFDVPVLEGFFFIFRILNPMWDCYNMQICWPNIVKKSGVQPYCTIVLGDFSALPFLMLNAFRWSHIIKVLVIYSIT